MPDMHLLPVSSLIWPTKDANLGKVATNATLTTLTLFVLNIKARTKYSPRTKRTIEIEMGY